MVQEELKCPCSRSRHLNEKPKLITDKLFLIYKLIPHSQPNSQTQENLNSHHIKFPKKKTRYIHQTHYIPKHRETKAQKFIYDLDIPKDEHTNL